MGANALAGLLCHLAESECLSSKRVAKWDVARDGDRAQRPDVAARFQRHIRLDRGTVADLGR